MAKKNYIKIGMLFTFINDEDTIVYKMLREFNETDDMFDYVKSYAEQFVKTYGYKYGRCIHCDVVCNAIPIYTYRFDRKGFVNSIIEW